MASYFQSYLQTSSMPKRLLQYALSRLELLDTDALDLENLDIAWGKNSVFEFKNVGLRLKKLEALLHLPPSIELTKARVLSLRIIIPVDIYISPILVEVDEVDIQLRVKSLKEGTIHKSRTDHDRKQKRPHKARQSPDQTGDEDPDGALPTATDLAASFLQAEPDQEKAELEAALHDLSDSSVLSDDGEDELGAGAPLSLPNFMARFLNGIVDRLQVRVRNITLNLDVDLPNESSKAHLPNATDAVTVQLRVDDVDVEGVTTGKEESAQAERKSGKRRIALSNVRGFLISEANFFSSLSRSSALSSPSAAQSDVFDDGRASKSSTSIPGGLSRSFDGASSPEDMERSKLSEVSHVKPLSRQTSNPRSLGGSIVASDSGRFEDAPEDDEISTISTSIHADQIELDDSFFANSGHLSQVTESQFFDDAEEEEDEPTISTIPSVRNLPSRAHPPSALSTPRASLHSQSRQSSRISTPKPMEESFPRLEESTILPTRTPRFSAERISDSQASLPGIDASTTSSTYQEFGVSSHQATSSSKYLSDSGEDEEESEDLTQSKLFSHEQAESMYMSAISHDSSPSRIPGGWAPSSDGSNATVSPPRSPPAPLQVEDEHLDNLEHALHAPIESSQELGTASRTSDSPTESASASRRLSFSNPLATRSETVPSIPESSSNVSERSAASSGAYSRLTKQFLVLDKVEIYVPGVEPRNSTEPIELLPSSSIYGSGFGGHGDGSQSTTVNVPGAFSSHIPGPRTPPRPRAPRAEATPLAEETPESEDKMVESEVGSLVIQFDISVGRMVFKIINYIKEVLGQDSAPVSRPSTPKDVTKSTDGIFSFNAGELSLRFLESLPGTLVALGANSEATPLSTDILLQTTLAGLMVETEKSGLTTTTAVSLKKVNFGYAKENIVSFNADLQMRASVRDLRASAGIDLSAQITRTPTTTRCEITTLPMHISVDLQRLDETFSWFGGLSSVLNLGSSIASNATITAVNSPSRPKPRGVRFETPISPDDKSVASQNKADVRIGGFVLDLVGTECRVGLETSAVKIVSRDEGIGLSIQKVRLSGPHLRQSNEDPAITIDVTSTRLEYLTSPKDVDLDRLLSLITPSKAKYDQDDDILIDTLLRQRKQGAVLRLTVDDCKATVGRLNELSFLPELGEEVARLSTVAKYLPDDDRPGLFSLITVRNFSGDVDFDHGFGSIQLSTTDVEVAQITLPSLIALSVGGVTARRNNTQEILGIATDPELREPRARSPTVMARMIGDEMEPIVKIKLWNLKVEYRVATLATILGLAERFSQDMTASISASVATLTDLARNKRTQVPPSKPESDAKSLSKPLTIDLVLRDCIVGLNPTGLPSQVLFAMTEAHLEATLPKDGNSTASLDISKASILVIDDTANVSKDVRNRRQSYDGGSTQIADLCAYGYVSVSYISSAKAMVKVTNTDGETSMDVELRDDLFVLESCADSTQTLVTVLNSLSPPTVPSREVRYRTEVMPVQDLLASLSGDAFGTAEGAYNIDDDFEVTESDDGVPEGDEGEFGFDSHYYQGGDVLFDEAIAESQGSISASQLATRDTQDGVLLESLIDTEGPEASEPLNFQEDHFGTGSILEGTAHRWNSAKNTYDRSNAAKIKKSPFKACVRDVHFIWNLYDGYDWQQTRDKITKAVHEVESKAIEKRNRNQTRPTFDQDIDDEETVIGDFLFNSIYIGIPANRDPRELTAAINQELNDNATETESIATTMTATPSRRDSSRKPKSSRLRLNRSKHHKITFELRGVNVDVVAFPPASGETQSSIDIRVRDVEVFDHVPTSTWRKFATYMQDAGERETGTSMIHIEILNVRPIPELAASEIVLKATVLPLRLHVDQDALDFITRFFEFKDDSAPVNTSPSEVPFIQRAEVNSVVVKLDFKPKRVDYAGLRSGHTTEFMNFLILDEADMVLRHTIIYGISGFDKLGKCLNDIWMPDIKRNQLPGILAGLAPVRSLVNVGGGFQQLIVVPMREYKKDGRIVRSISKGAAAFAKTTGTEVVKLGAKVAIGVQTVLQGVEGFLGSPTERSTPTEGEDADEETKQISPYANQPIGVLQGLRGGYAGLQRDLIMARDAIIAVPGEVMEEGNAKGALKALRKHAPTVILRPAIGIAKAGGQILMGATNSLDPVNLQRADAKYKKH